MNIKDIGVIINKKPLKENTFIITVFTENHGLYSGVVKNSARKNNFIYQEGNIVDFFWQARLHEHIGMAKCELIKSYSWLLLKNKTILYAFNSIIFLIKTIFHERENHHNFFPIFVAYLGRLAQNFSFKEYIDFELAILGEAGYRLSVDCCAVTGKTSDLCYVSPKSGKAICASVGAPYKDKLLMLPEFLARRSTSEHEIGTTQKSQAFLLTSYFFNRYIFHTDRQSSPREALIEYLLDT